MHGKVHAIKWIRELSTSDTNVMFVASRCRRLRRVCERMCSVAFKCFGYHPPKTQTSIRKSYSCTVILHMQNKYTHFFIRTHTYNQQHVSSIDALDVFSPLVWCREWSNFKLAEAIQKDEKLAMIRSQFVNSQASMNLLCTRLTILPSFLFAS